METNPASTTRDTKPNTFRVAPAGWTPRPADRIGFDGLLLGLIEALVPPAATEAADEFEEMKEALGLGDPQSFEAAMTAIGKLGDAEAETYRSYDEIEQILGKSDPAAAVAPDDVSGGDGGDDGGDKDGGSSEEDDISGDSDSDSDSEIEC